MGKPAFTAQEAIQAARDIEAGQKEKRGLVIKAQIHAGGRGRGTFKESGLQGGVHLVSNSAEVSHWCLENLNVHESKNSHP